MTPMRRFRASSRLPIMQFVLAICLPLCCCQLQVLVAMMSGSANKQNETACVAMSCCSTNIDSTNSSTVPTDDSESESHAGSCACCIKIFTQERGESQSLILQLTGFAIVAPTLGLESASSRTCSWLESTQLVSDPGARTLLRQRCAILI